MTKKPIAVASSPKVIDVHTTRTAQGLRDALFEELDNLRSGRSSPRQSNAVAHVAAEIIKSVFMEIEFHNVMHRLQNGAEDPTTIPAVAGELQLGTL